MAKGDGLVLVDGMIFLDPSKMSPEKRAAWEASENERYARQRREHEAYYPDPENRPPMFYWPEDPKEGPPVLRECHFF
jgi:hypothetical protein